MLIVNTFTFFYVLKDHTAYKIYFMKKQKKQSLTYETTTNKTSHFCLCDKVGYQDPKWK